MSKIRIRLKRSTIGYARNQGRVVRALGLKRLHQEVEHEDSPTILGMVHKVRHLVEVRAGEQ